MVQVLSETASDTSLFCACHPDIKPDTPHTLCSACQEFTDKCHWIRNHKLPLPNLANISREEWKNGAYISDGDFSKGLNWDYELGIKGRSSQCHLCALFDTVGSNSGDSERPRIWDDGVKVKIRVYFARPLVQQPGGTYLDSGTDSGSETDRISESEDCSRLASTSEVDDEDEAVQPSDPEKPIEASIHVTVEDAKGERDGILRLVHELETAQSVEELSISTESGLSTDLFSPRSKCTGSPSIVSCAKTWLANCIQNHPECKKSQKDLNPGTNVTFPSRLIDVGDASLDPHLHILPPSVLVPPYTTLSHRWGLTMPLKLTKTNLTALTERIPFTALSNTFQQAITTVRNMGQKYIWIDSLCIIQDSEDDWNRESTYMGAIYTNSVLTIAATASSNGEQGCFRTRHVLPTTRCRVWEDTGLEDPTRRIWIDVEGEQISSWYRQDINRAPLNSRAWVWQERSLSPRLLSFSQQGVYWDCQSAHYFDSGRVIENDEHLSAGFGEGGLYFLEGLENLEDDAFSLKWMSAVERYCNMDISKETDRLIAVRGIISSIEKLCDKKCVSGLWKHDILNELLWRIGDSHVGRGERTLGVPSWSWAAVGKGVRYFPPNVDNMAMGFWYPNCSVDSGFFSAEDGGQYQVDPDFPETKPCADFLYFDTDSHVVSLKATLIPQIPAATVLFVRDIFTVEEETDILDAITIPNFTNSSESERSEAGEASQHKLLITIFPDLLSPMQELPSTAQFLPLDTTPVKKLRREGFFHHMTSEESDVAWTRKERREENEMIAPEVIWWDGLVVIPSVESGVWERWGFFRGVESWGFKGSDKDEVKGQYDGKSGELVRIIHDVKRVGWFGGGKREVVRIW